jgi:hypothetical protein
MGKSGKKPRQKMDARVHDAGSTQKKKKEQDWTFDDIVRSKSGRR